MFDLNQHQSTVILGLSLNGSESDLLNSTIGIAKSSNSRLVLAHILLPLQAYLYVNGESPYSFSSYERDIDLLAEKRFLAELESIKKSIVDIESHRVEIKILHNDPALGLIQLAKEMKASLLVCGYRSDESKDNLLGLSTANALMSEPPCPVLAIPLTRGLKFPGRVAFADDLHEESRELLGKCCEWMQTLGLRELYHLHIKNLSLQQMKHLEDTIQSAILVGAIPEKSTFTQQTYRQQMTDYLSELLRRRFEELEARTRQFIAYQAVVDFGSPLQKLKDIIQSLEIEMALFGSHKFFHRNSWSFGSLPYRSMFSFSCGVLLLPR